MKNSNRYAKSFEASRAGAKSEFAWSVRDANEAKELTGNFVSRIAKMDPGYGASVAQIHLNSLLEALDEAAANGTITRVESQEMKKRALQAYRSKFSRTGAKAAFSWNSETAHINELLNVVMRELEAGNSGNKHRAKQALRDAQAALFNLHDSFARAGAKAKFDNTSTLLKKAYDAISEGDKDYAESYLSALKRIATRGGMTAEEVQHYESLKDIAYRYRIRFSRAGAKAAFGMESDEFVSFIHEYGDDINKAVSDLDEPTMMISDNSAHQKVAKVIKFLINGFAEAGMKPPRRVKEAYDYAKRKGMMSRAGAKSDGLTIAQRIAVEHDAKRMAAR